MTTVPSKRRASTPAKLRSPEFMPNLERADMSATGREKCGPNCAGLAGWPCGPACWRGPAGWLAGMRRLRRGERYLV